MICRSFSCIFVHIPKTAGRSVEKFFLNKLGLDRDNADDRQQLLLVDNDDPNKGTQKLTHLSASEYVDCGHISAEEFSSYFKFSFVRNPWARIVSEYRYRNFFGHKSFKDFVLNRLPAPGWDDKYRHIMPQTEMLYDRDGKLLVDFVGKFERLQSDFDQVCTQLGFTQSRLPHVNSSDKKSRELRRRIRNRLRRNSENSFRNYTEFYDAETRESVAKLYRGDIEAFGYTFDDAVKN